MDSLSGSCCMLDVVVRVFMAKVPIALAAQ